MNRTEINLFREALALLSRFDNMGLLKTNGIAPNNGSETFLSPELEKAIEDICRFNLKVREELECEDEDDISSRVFPGEDMDGDHASALASAGFGTDEDYGGGCEHLD